jgi:hypothetical protein
LGKVGALVEAEVDWELAAAERRSGWKEVICASW